MTTSRLEWSGLEFERNNNNVNKRFDITERDEMRRMWGRTEKTMAGQNHLGWNSGTVRRFRAHWAYFYAGVFDLGKS
jgi:hypothetical protein